MDSQFTQSHFELFGLPAIFDIDSLQLAARYRDLQRTVHPDRYASAPDRERRLAVQRAAQINAAFQILKSPLQRARYLLQLRGVNFSDEHETTLDSNFLMHQMELREALAGIRSSIEPAKELQHLQGVISKDRKDMLSLLGTLLSAAGEEAQLEAKALVQKLQFLQRLQQEAEDLEVELFD